MKTAPNLHPNVAITGKRRDLTGGDLQCPVRERDGSRCPDDSEMWTYGHICRKHSEQLRRGRKLILVNGARLDRLWSNPGRLGIYGSSAAPEEQP